MAMEVVTRRVPGVSIGPRRDFAGHYRSAMDAFQQGSGPRDRKRVKKLLKQ
jgi:hypothetical protein